MSLLDTAALEAQRLVVEDELIVGRATVGACANTDLQQDQDQNVLVVNGDMEVRDTRCGSAGSGSILVHGDLVFAASDGDGCAKMTTLPSQCAPEAPLVLDIVYDEACNARVDEYPDRYVQRGPGISYEAKQVGDLLPNGPAYQIGILETTVLSLGDAAICSTVLQSLWTAPFQGLSGIFRRASSPDGWTDWIAVATTPVVEVTP